MDGCSRVEFRDTPTLSCYRFTAKWSPGKRAIFPINGVGCRVEKGEPQCPTAHGTHSQFQIQKRNDTLPETPLQTIYLHDLGTHGRPLSRTQRTVTVKEKMGTSTLETWQKCLKLKRSVSWAPQLHPTVGPSGRACADSLKDQLETTQMPVGRRAVGRFTGRSAPGTAADTGWLPDTRPRKSQVPLTPRATASAVREGWRPPGQDLMAPMLLARPGGEDQVQPLCADPSDHEFTIGALL